ncbi:MAG: 3'-5' exonuclease [Flavobacteriales bacterium]
MLHHVNPENILFIDIETVPNTYTYEELDEKTRELWDKKSNFMKREGDESAAELYEKAGIFSEFGKIICISVGFLRITDDNNYCLRIKSFSGNEEKTLLNEFNELLNKNFNKDNHYLCGHNVKEFDIPYICRRNLVNGLKLPYIIDIAGKKPWEVNHLDTLELWKFGDRKNYTSLDLLTHIFDIPTPKEDIEGSEVSRVFWEENDLKKIVEYCERDVVAVTQLFLRYRGEELVKDNNVQVV